MTFTKNLPAVIMKARSLASVLDAGGRIQPRRSGTHALDLAPYGTRRRNHALGRDLEERFSAASWTGRNAGAGAAAMPR